MSEEVTINRYSTRPNAWISLAVGGLFGLMALVGLVFWPLLLVALPGLIIAAAIDRKRWHCGNCGNVVEKTSTMCPVCRARLMSEAEYRMIYAKARAAAAREKKQQRQAEAAKPKLVRRVKKKSGPKRGGW